MKLLVSLVWEVELHFQIPGVTVVSQTITEV